MPVPFPEDAGSREGTLARSPKNTLVRRLALAKLNELRAAGLSYREIGRRYGAQRGSGDRRGAFEYRLSPERLLSHGSDAAEDQRALLAALDSLTEGIGFYALNGAPIVLNRALSETLRSGSVGKQLNREIEHLLLSLRSLVNERGLVGTGGVSELVARPVDVAGARRFLRGSHVGLPLFGGPGSLLIVLERAATDPPTEADLRRTWGLTRKEAAVALLLADGKSNNEIAVALFISPHTARTHTKRILNKLGVRTRAELAARLRGGG